MSVFVFNNKKMIMKTTLFFSIILFIGFFSCKKDSSSTGIGLDGSNFIDTVSTKRYYASEIIQPKFSGLYNNWKLIHTYCSFATRVDYSENFIFKPYGIYCITRNDTTIGFGQINIVKQDSELIINFTPDKLSGTFFGNSDEQVNFGKDTLLLSGPYLESCAYEFIKQ
jgi:hypothetical protein